MITRESEVQFDEKQSIVGAILIKLNKPEIIYIKI